MAVSARTNDFAWEKSLSQWSSPEAESVRQTKCSLLSPRLGSTLLA